MKAISLSHATEPKSFMIMIIITLTLIYPPKCNNYFLNPIANLWTTVLKRQNNIKNKPIPVCGKLRQNKTIYSIFGYTVPIYSQTFT